jgi:hypothetical protein
LIIIIQKSIESPIQLDCEIDKENPNTCVIKNAVVSNESEEIEINFNGNSSSVEIVWFRQSSISHVPNQIFDYFPNLDQLNIPSVSLKTIDELSNCGKLSSFYAPENKLKILKRNAFTKCGNLKNLYLNDNPIERLEAGFIRPNKNYMYLNFRNCSINEIDPQIFDGFEKIDFLGLLGNHCIDRDFYGLNSNNLNETKEFFEECFFNFDGTSTTMESKTTTNGLTSTTEATTEEPDSTTPKPEENRRRRKRGIQVALKFNIKN